MAVRICVKCGILLVEMESEAVTCQYTAEISTVVLRSANPWMTLVNISTSLVNTKETVKLPESFSSFFWVHFEAFASRREASTDTEVTGWT
jgi:hypothetical protein